MRLSARCSLSLAVLVVLAALSPAPQAFADRGGTHDGFFLRLSTGLGYASVSGDNDNSGTFKGGTGQGSIAIGGIVTDNLALHADIFAATLFNPDYERNGTTTGTPDNVEVTMRAGAIGIGLTYYFMPINLYLSGSIGPAFVSTEIRYTLLGFQRTATYESDTGVGINLMVGKEWWVSENWGVGVAGQLIYVNIPVKDGDSADDKISGASGGVLFTATYN